MPRKKKSDEPLSVEDDVKTEEQETRQEPTPKKRGRKAKSTIEKEIRDQLEAFLSSAALIWSTKDAVCSAALHENSTAIAAGLARICGKSKHAAKIAESITDTAVWVPFGIALSQFSMTVYHHHFSPEAHNHAESSQADVFANLATGEFDSTGSMAGTP